VLLPGQASDKAAVAALIEGMSGGADLVGDRGYDARAVLDLVEAAGGQAHIPTCRDRKVSARSIRNSTATATSSSASSTSSSTSAASPPATLPAGSFRGDF